MNKKTIVVDINNPKSNKEYISFLEKRFNVEIYDSNKHVKANIALFTGGADVHPSLYGEKIGKYTNINEKREVDDDSLYKKHYSPEYNKSLFLGICRGGQFLTIKSGGKLIQHVENHDGKKHYITLENGNEMEMTSSHHQMMYPFNLNENKYDLIAHSTYFRSPIYLNGDNQQIELDLNFLEPEIVYYKNTNSLCIQGHPEWSNCPEKTVEYCLDLIEKYLNEN